MIIETLNILISETKPNPNAKNKHVGKIDKRILKALKKEPKAYENFLSLPQVYKRIRIDSIQNTKNNKIFSKRLIKFIEECKNNILCWKCEEKIKAFSLK